MCVTQPGKAERGYFRPSHLGQGQRKEDKSKPNPVQPGKRKTWAPGNALSRQGGALFSHWIIIQICCLHFKPRVSQTLPSVPPEHLPNAVHKGNCTATTWKGARTR